MSTHEYNAGKNGSAPCPACSTLGLTKPRATDLASRDQLTALRDHLAAPLALPSR